MTQPDLGTVQPTAPSSRSSRTSGNGIAVRITAGFGLLLLIAVVMILHGWIHGDLNDRNATAELLNEEELYARITRSGEVGGPVESNDIRRWMEEILAGNTDETAFLTRIFTGTDYLSRGRNDRAFAGDVHRVLDGRPSDADWLDRADVFFTHGGSRITFLRHVPDIVQVETPEGSVRSMTLRNRFQQVGTVTIGVAVVEADYRMDKVKARVALYVDDRIRHSQNLDEGTTSFQVKWDTRQEKSGSHDVMILLRSSDGRGRVIERGTFITPNLGSVAENAVTPLVLVGQEQWYYLEPDAVDVWFNTYTTEGNLGLELYDLQSNKLVNSDLQMSGHETLRYRGEDPGAGYYARVMRGKSHPDRSAVSYQVTVTDMSLVIPETGELLAVLDLDRSGGRVTAAGKDGQARTLTVSGVQLIEYTARLSALQLWLPNSEPIDLYPAFNRDSEEYGLYLPESLTLESNEPLSFSVEAQEGSAAILDISNLQENGRKDRFDANGDLVPGRSENTFQIRITGYDGSQRTVRVHILYGPHSGGYDRDTLLQFPDGYASGLWLLHVQHPDYEFEAFDTNIEWVSFVDKQDEADRSLIQATTVPSSWVEPGSPVYDGEAWKAAARPVIEYYGDPRNFLNTRELFQFERLAFDPTVHTRDGVSAILAGTFMEADLETFADIFHRAGETAGISPYFLASRAIQEMGSQGQSPLADGTLSGYEGYYNFFNIGSYPNPSVPDGQRINGALFAMYGHDPEDMEITPDEEAVLLPWDTAEKSIIGGAMFIAERYVAVGQNTLYFQKFDVIPENGLYARQYAQNIQMAWAEGIRYYNAYDALGILESPFVFRIPFYNNMPYPPTELP